MLLCKTSWERCTRCQKSERAGVDYYDAECESSDSDWRDRQTKMRTQNTKRREERECLRADGHPWRRRHLWRF